MNKQIKFSIYFIFLLIFKFSIIADNINIVEEEKRMPDQIVTKTEEKKIAKEDQTISNVNIEIKELQLKYEKIKSSLEEIKNRINELSNSIDTIKMDIKKIDEKNLELKNVIEELDIQKRNLKSLEDDYQKEIKNLKNLFIDYEETKRNIKQGIDKVQSWDDILKVLKKEINNNELAIANLKKSINELKAGSNDDDILNKIIKWPYLGITSVVISLIAFFIAISK